LILFYLFVMEQHIFYLFRYYMFDFSSTLNPIHAIIVNLLALGTLCRNLSLHYTCATMECSLKPLRENDQSYLVKKRAKDAKLYFEQGYFTKDDVTTITEFESDYQKCVMPGEKEKLITDGIYCRYCDMIKPERTHHCRTCGHCALRLDHHCLFLHNCIGVNNFRYFIQLLVIAVLGSIQSLHCGYLARNHGIWNALTVVHPYCAIIVHSCWVVIYCGYLAYFWWMFKRDFTTIDYLD